MGFGPSGFRQPPPVLVLVRTDGTRCGGHHGPPAEQGLADTAPDLRFIARLGGEENPQTDDAPIPFGCGVMRRQRTRRVVLPMPAQGDSYRATGCPEIVFVAYRHHRVMGKDLAHIR